MKSNQRRVLLGIATVATVVAVVFAPPPPEAGIVEPKTRTTREQVVVSPRAVAVIDRRAQLPSRSLRGVPPVFEVTSWEGPVENLAPQQVAVDTAPIEPQVPAVPFRIVGRYVDDGVTGMFVQYNDRTLLARVGEMIGDDYKVDSIDGQNLTVVYLPMNVSQTISTGAEN